MLSLLVVMGELVSLVWGCVVDRVGFVGRGCLAVMVELVVLVPAVGMFNRM